jgi:leader peptidase (prepilin peptidase) / N-methyltransferase
MSVAVWVALLGGLGLLVGSFLNVVAYRVPRGLSVARPGSACPSCEHPIRWYDNVPLLSWLLLAGRCRDCAAPIGWRYPAVELCTAALFATIGRRFGPSPLLVALLFVAAIGVALAVIDLDHQRLPFRITVPATGVTVALLGVDAVADGPGPVAVAAASAGAWLAVYAGTWLATSGRGMGLGDVVLAPLLGLVLGWLGWGPSLVGLLGGFLVGATVGVTLICTGRAGRRSRIPHGPFMLAGAALGLFVGEQLWSAYLSLVSPL